MWFGMAFNAVFMMDRPYVILVLPGKNDADAVEVVEQQIGTCGEEAQHCAGTRLEPTDLKVISSSIIDGERVVELERSRDVFAAGIIDPKKNRNTYYTFDPENASQINVMS